MEKAKIEKLVEKLQMQPEFQPLFESGEADGNGNFVGETPYERFERAVEDCLSRYGNGRSPLIFDPKKIVAVREWDDKDRKFKIKAYRGKPVTLNNFNEAIEIFKRYYGIGCKPQTAKQIADEVFGIARLTQREIERMLKKPYGEDFLDNYYPDLYAPRKKPNRVELVVRRVRFVTEVLKQRHKADIWYGVL